MSFDKNSRYLGLTFEGDTFVTADHSVKLNEVNILATPPSSGTITVTLPNVHEAAGRIFTVTSDGNDTGTVTVAASGTADTFTSVVLTADQDRVVVMSDGRNWNTLFSLAT